MGFRDGLRERGISLPQHLEFEGNFDYRSGAKAAAYLLNEKSSVTAVWCQDDLMAIGMIKELHRHGVDVPGGISVMGMDDIELGGVIDPGLTTVAQPFEQMCQQATSLIQQMMKRDGSRSAETMTMKPFIVERESVRAVLED